MQVVSSITLELVYALGRTHPLPDLSTSSPTSSTLPIRFLPLRTKSLFLSVILHIGRYIWTLIGTCIVAIVVPCLVATVLYSLSSLGRDTSDTGLLQLSSTVTQCNEWNPWTTKPWTLRLRPRPKPKPKPTQNHPKNKKIHTMAHNITSHDPQSHTEPTYTVFIRLPFPRGDFIDPPLVNWDPSKDEALWNIVSNVSKTEIDCKHSLKFNEP